MCVFIFKIFLSVIAIKYYNTVEVWNKIILKEGHSVELNKQEKFPYFIWKHLRALIYIFPFADVNYLGISRFISKLLINM